VLPQFLALVPVRVNQHPATLRVSLAPDHALVAMPDFLRLVVIW
jgi:hypothetical protein